MVTPFLNELFWGLIGLIGVGIAIIFEMRKNRGLFERLSDLFKDTIQITVDEKTAMLYVMHNLYQILRVLKMNLI